VVDAIYRQVLERGADRGSAGYVERLSSGSTTVRELVREIAKSPEHIQRFLSSSNREEGASYLYRHLLGRQPDLEGQRAHAQGLAAKGPSAVIDAFVNSAEYDQKFHDDIVPGTQVRFCGFGEDEGGPVSSNYNRGQMRFRGMDRNDDGIITRSEWRGNRESFIANDWNGDGVLSGEEVRVGGRRDADVDSVSANQWTEANFSNLDRNRDGRVTQNEWPYDIAAFRAADTNRNGALTMWEFTRAGADTGYSSARATERERFNNMDTNRDGRLTFDEWNASGRAFDLLDTDQDGEITRAEFFGTYR
jgi:Ca2+-binding EF-hand superfamily protein